MRVAAIDIGTNTILLLVAEVFPDGRVTPALELQEIPRLGKSVDAKRYLSQEAIQRSARIIERYAKAARAAGPCGSSRAERVPFETRQIGTSSSGWSPNARALR